jgi:ribose/xylose/arabinose/galactoside ABC-type transport system permease subunit
MAARTQDLNGSKTLHRTPLALRLWNGFARWDLASVVIALIIICGALLIFVPAFRSAYNLRALGFTVAVTGVVALAQVCVLSVGQFNLALTAMGAMVGFPMAPRSSWASPSAALPAPSRD